MSVWKCTTGTQGAEIYCKQSSVLGDCEQREEKKENIPRCELTDHTRNKNLENQYFTLK